MATLLKGLQAPPGAMVIMDRSMATQANLTWLVENGYRYPHLEAHLTLEIRASL